MAKIDYIYEAVDDFGLITSAEAADLGMSRAEMVQQEKQLKEIVANNNEELTGLQSVLQESSGAKVEVSGEV
ncbi:hypothetical protein, partial [uncultured Senegalimassilia sp.]|uniref:hypothetical protein n=1 Tax=uncultured Senegalimassilia sp. TaxID=1714350 RepID=UPI0025E1C5D4